MFQNLDRTDPDHRNYIQKLNCIVEFTFKAVLSIQTEKSLRLRTGQYASVYCIRLSLHEANAFFNEAAVHIEGSASCSSMFDLAHSFELFLKSSCRQTFVFVVPFSFSVGFSFEAV